MTMKRTWKLLALAGVAALGLTLTACYVPPDDLGNGQNISGSNNSPFQTVNVTQAPTPTPTVAPQTAPPVVPVATVNWDNNGNGAAANRTNSPIAQTTIAVVTATPTLKPTNTPRPTNTPAPTASSLKRGSKGASVKAVQQRLKDLGYLKGSADGDFGEATEQAVKAFQKANGLTADGKVGKQTLEKLNSSSAKRASATAKPTSKPKTTAKPGSKPTAKTTAKPTPNPKSTTPSYAAKTYLELGASGEKTRSLQKRLIELGWLAGKADGNYGGATDAAVRAFQKKTSGLWSDGIAGPDTITALYSTNAARSSTPVASIGQTLELGMNGGAVRALQTRLKALGYLSGTVDGSFGGATEAAVIAFQYTNGLKADGKAGTDTLNKLYAQSATPSSGIPSSEGSGSSGSVSSTGYVTLRPNDEDPAVRKLQQTLKNKGFYTGTVDGKYGSGTTAAVMAFQSLNHLTVDGVAGPATQRLLYGTGGSSITYSSLSEGSTGEAVRTLQYTLYELGYYSASIDGSFGPSTSDAVRAFQYRNGLNPDGKAGNQTLQKLYSSSARAANAPATSFGKLKKGDHGEAVLELKDKLMQYGYLHSDNGTNIYDDDTVAAVILFQQKNGLSPDGIAGNETQTKLYSGHVVHN